MKTLETERLILRDWQESDLDDFYEYAKVEGVGEMAGWRHHESKEESKNILDAFIREADNYAIVLKEKNKVIGSLGIHNRIEPDYKAEIQREIGYVLSKDYWGNGYVPEAVKAAIKYAFEELNADVLWCGHFLDNTQSQRVIEKCGFKYYKNHVKESKALGKIFNCRKYVITKEDYYEIIINNR
ncbi:MAG: GNAT family N-acetyltransferase [Oscillospiraceae bacterium]|nr:GNAT family N-acetyltransferase [Oscillospiraceae bacterium]